MLANFFPEVKSSQTVGFAKSKLTVRGSTAVLVTYILPEAVFMLKQQN
jgi:hypothetical protein